MSAVLCVCGCPQGRHLLARRDCKSCPDCAQFEPVARRPVAVDVAVLLGEVQADVAREAAGERLYEEHVRHLCPVCGGRYRELHNHPCGPLVPVRVRITFIEE